MWQLGSDKALGPNGFPICFYQSFCEVLKHDMRGTMNEFYEGKTLVNRINHSMVVQMPKTDNPKGGDFRPICFLNCTIKILAKVMANRLKPILCNIIGCYQARFVSGGYILDNVVAATKAIHSCGKRGESG